MAQKRKNFYNLINNVYFIIPNMSEKKNFKNTKYLQNFSCQNILNSYFNEFLYKKSYLTVNVGDTLEEKDINAFYSNQMIEDIMVDFEDDDFNEEVNLNKFEINLFKDNLKIIDPKFDELDVLDEDNMYDFEPITLNVSNTIFNDDDVYEESINIKKIITINEINQEDYTEKNLEYNWDEDFNFKFKIPKLEVDDELESYELLIITKSFFYKKSKKFKFKKGKSKNKKIKYKLIKYKRNFFSIAFYNFYANLLNQKIEGSSNNLFKDNKLLYFINKIDTTTNKILYKSYKLKKLSLTFNKNFNNVSKYLLKKLKFIKKTHLLKNQPTIIPTFNFIFFQKIKNIIYNSTELNLLNLPNIIAEIEYTSNQNNFSIYNFLFLTKENVDKHLLSFYTDLHTFEDEEEYSEDSLEDLFSNDFVDYDNKEIEDLLQPINYSNDDELFEDLNKNNIKENLTDRKINKNNVKYSLNSENFINTNNIVKSNTVNINNIINLKYNYFCLDLITHLNKIINFNFKNNKTKIIKFNKFYGYNIKFKLFSKFEFLYNFFEFNKNHVYNILPQKCFWYKNWELSFLHDKTISVKFKNFNKNNIIDYKNVEKFCWLISFELLIDNIHPIFFFPMIKLRHSMLFFLTFNNYKKNDINYNENFDDSDKDEYKNNVDNNSNENEEYEYEKPYVYPQRTNCSNFGDDIEECEDDDDDEYYDENDENFGIDVDDNFYEQQGSANANGADDFTHIVWKMSQDMAKKITKTIPEYIEEQKRANKYKRRFKLEVKRLKEEKLRDMFGDFNYNKKQKIKKIEKFTNTNEIVPVKILKTKNFTNKKQLSSIKLTRVKKNKTTVNINKYIKRFLYKKKINCYFWDFFFTTFFNKNFFKLNNNEGLFIDHKKYNFMEFYYKNLESKDVKNTNFLKNWNFHKNMQDLVILDDNFNDFILLEDNKYEKFKNFIITLISENINIDYFEYINKKKTINTFNSSKTINKEWVYRFFSSVDIKMLDSEAKIEKHVLNTDNNLFINKTLNKNINNLDIIDYGLDNNENNEIILLNPDNVYNENYENIQNNYKNDLFDNNNDDDDDDDSEEDVDDLYDNNVNVEDSEVNYRNEDDESTFFFDFYNKRLATYRNARITHWTFFNSKKLNARKYDNFIRVFLKNKKKYLFEIIDYFTFKFKLSFSFWLDFISLYFFFLKKKIQYKQIYQLPLDSDFWTYLKKINLKKLDTDTKIDLWAQKITKIENTFWMQQKKNFPKFLKKKTYWNDYIDNSIQYDFLTNYFIILKKYKFITTSKSIIFKNKFLKLNNFRYKS